MTTIQEPKYYFRFFNIQKNESYYIYLEKLNDLVDRFDLFSLNLPVELDLPTGGYTYKVYQSHNVLNTDVSTMLLLECGRAEVVKDFDAKKFNSVSIIKEINYI